MSRTALLGVVVGFAISIGIHSADNAFADGPTWRAYVITGGLMVLGFLAGGRGEKK